MPLDCRRRSARFWPGWSSEKAISVIRSRTTSVRSATCWSVSSSSRLACRWTSRSSSPLLPRCSAGRRLPRGKAVLVALVASVLRWPAHVALRVERHPGARRRVRAPAAHPGNGCWHDRYGPGQAMLVALAFTMALAPILIQHSAALGGSRQQRRHGGRRRKEEEAVAHGGWDLSDHVILCGCGRVGRLVAVVLEAAKVPYLAIESDLTRFREAKHAGSTSSSPTQAGPASFIGRAWNARGYSWSPSTSDGPWSGCCTARAIAIPTSSRSSARPTTESCRALTEAGATVVFPENLAAGLALADQVLLLKGLSQEQAASIITEVRAGLNPELRGRVGI